MAKLLDGSIIKKSGGDEIIETTAGAQAKVDVLTAIRTATLTTTWIGSVAPFTQTVLVTGLTVNDNPLITPVYDSLYANAVLERDAWAMVDKIDIGNGSITATCFDSKPTRAINLQIKGV